MFTLCLALLAQTDPLDAARKLGATRNRALFLDHFD